MRHSFQEQFTYWPVTGENEFGEEAFGTPVAFYGRKEDRTEQVRTPSGTDIISKAVVWCPFNAVIGAYIAPGDQSDIDDPNDAEGALEIQDVRNIRSLRTNQNEVRAIL